MKLLLYGGVLTLLYIIFSPFLLLLSLKKKYHLSIPARFFLWRNPPLRHYDVWFHACSLGETKSLDVLTSHLNSEYFCITTTTATGFKEGLKQTPHTRFLPFEIFLPFWVPQVRLCVVTESELWPLMLWSAKRKGAKTILINGRISDRSVKKYNRFAFFYRFVFSLIDTVYAQSHKDAERLRYLGAKNIKIAGNMKAYATIKPTQTFIKPNKYLIIAGSTHQGEEELILKSYYPNIMTQLIIVPRHPERFNEVEHLIRSYGFSYAKFSQDGLDETKEVILVDKMGELINLYAIADIVILGGSFVPVGGHNPIEVAHFGAKLISGYHIFNQHTLYESVEGVVFSHSDELATFLEQKESLPSTQRIIPQGWHEILNEVILH